MSYGYRTPTSFASEKGNKQVRGNSPRDFLSPTGRFLFGKHKGELADSVASSDPSYLRWIVNDVEDCSEEDRNILSTLLEQRGRS